MPWRGKCRHSEWEQASPGKSLKRASAPWFGSEPAVRERRHGTHEGQLPSRSVLAALARLSPTFQRALLLRHWVRLPAAEIAAYLGITQTAAQLLHLHAVEALNQALRGTAPPESG